jgi:hypothetical protein
MPTHTLHDRYVSRDKHSTTDAGENIPRKHVREREIIKTYIQPIVIV